MAMCGKSGNYCVCNIVRVAGGLSGPPEKDVIASFEVRIREPQGKSGIWVAVSAGKRNRSNFRPIQRQDKRPFGP